MIPGGFDLSDTTNKDSYLHNKKRNQMSCVGQILSGN